jgi:type IV secretion system protein VirD4
MREFRNIIAILAVWFGTIFAVTYACAFLLTILVWGWAYIYPLHLGILNNLVLVGKWMFNNYPQLTNWEAWKANNGLAIRFVVSILVTYGPALIALKVKYYTIKHWQPFPEKENIHGSAHWATEHEVRKANLRHKEGLILGKDKKGMFIAKGYEHVLLFAPTGSGKGVGIAIPNLLHWDQSVIVHDIKLENYMLTSGYRKRKMKQQVYLWSPASTEYKTHRYNPLDWISPSPGKMVDDVQKISNLILPKQEFWENEARALLTAIILYLVAVPEKPTSFGEVARTAKSDDVVYHFAVVLDTIGKHIHPVAYMNLAAFLQKADKERSGVISTLNSHLDIFSNPIVDTSTSASDFNVKMIKKHLMSVFVGITPNNMQRMAPLLKVFYQQATEFLSTRIPEKHEEPYGVLFLMDEFPTLGKMEQFMSGIAYFRGYNVRLLLIIQDTEQLKGIYEEAGMNTFISNSKYRITYSANNIQTAEYISKTCGNKTAKQYSQNKPKFLDFNPASRSLHESEVQRALLLPQEVMQLDTTKEIILVEGMSPINALKVKYYDDSHFKKRLLPAEEVPIQERFDPKNYIPQGPRSEEENLV